jgi:DNA adenine methylase
MTDKPVKPLMRYYGGKWNLAPWVISYFPEHRVYVEPYGGAASVLMQKEPAFSEVYNDMDDDIVNLFSVLRDRSNAEELKRQLRLTPYARIEFEQAYEESDESIERSRRTLIRSWMGHSTVGAHRKTGFRTNVKYVRRSTPAGDWKRLVDYLDLVIERLRDVNIENRPAIDVIEGHDYEDALFYIDPPYPHAVRNDKVYRHEMEDVDHRVLAECLHEVQGMCVISGYDCDLYDELYSRWHRVERDAYADGAQKRVEVLWISPNAKLALDRSRLPLFSRLG